VLVVISLTEICVARTVFTIFDSRTHQCRNSDRQGTRAGDPV